MNGIDLEKYNVSYFHFDFHSECKENSEPMSNFLKTEILPRFMKEMGIF